MKRVFIAALAAFFAVSCVQDKPRLVILHANDTHSHLEAERSGELQGHGGIIERAAFVDSVRKANGADNVLLVHAGDFNQGSSYYSELGGSIEVELVNAIGYDCMTFGNHELDNGIEDLAARVQKLNTTLVCANLDLSSFPGFEKVKPYAIFNKGGMKVGIIGLECDITTVVSKMTSSRIPQLDPIEVTNKWAEYLRNEEKCDLVLVLSHQGYREDHDIAAATRNVDLIIGGHTHTFVDDFDYVENLDGKKVPVITDGCWGLEMGEVKIY